MASVAIKIGDLPNVEIACLGWSPADFPPSIFLMWDGRDSNHPRPLDKVSCACRFFRFSLLGARLIQVFLDIFLCVKERNEGTDCVVFLTDDGFFDGRKFVPVF
jgi:hypothetical protein